MKVVKHWSDTPPTPVDMEGAKDITKRVVLGPEDGTPSVAQRVFTVHPGGHTPHHTHPYEHLNVVLEGEGVLRTADGVVDLAPGTMALILPDELHQFRNPGDTDLHIVCVVPNEFA